MFLDYYACEFLKVKRSLNYKRIEIKHVWEVLGIEGFLNFLAKLLDLRGTCVSCCTGQLVRGLLERSVVHLVISVSEFGQSLIELACLKLL